MNRYVEKWPTRVPRRDEPIPPNTRRWVASRKAAVIITVRNGKITMDEALSRYQLTEEEFLSWQRAFDRYGLRGLRATRVQQYRSSSGEEDANGPP